MQTYSMQCTCGDTMSVDAANRTEGVAKLKEIMNAEAVAKHFQEKHAGQEVATMEQVHMTIDQQLMPME